MANGRPMAARHQPASQNSPRNSSRPLLTGIARGHGDRWEAFSLDFDLAVEGTSFADVQASLAQAIQMYLQAALAEPEPIRSRLLNRRAPFRVRLAFAWRLFRATLSGHAGRRERASDTFEFVACPA
jgi:hypothetical protein